MKGYSSPKSPWLLLVLLVIGGLIGGLLGAAFGNMLPILNQGFDPIGLNPTTINLKVITITFGLIFKLNVASIIGFILALFVYFRI